MSAIVELSDPGAPRDSGQALIEYALIITLIAVVAIGALQLTGVHIKSLLNEHRRRVLKPNRPAGRTRQRPTPAGQGVPVRVDPLAEPGVKVPLRKLGRLIRPDENRCVVAGVVNSSPGPRRSLTALTDDH